MKYLFWLIVVLILFSCKEQRGYRVMTVNSIEFFYQDTNLSTNVAWDNGSSPDPLVELSVGLTYGSCGMFYSCSKELLSYEEYFEDQQDHIFIDLEPYNLIFMFEDACKGYENKYADPHISVSLIDVDTTYVVAGTVVQSGDVMCYEHFDDFCDNGFTTFPSVQSNYYQGVTTKVNLSWHVIYE